MLSRETSGEVVSLQTVTPSSGPAEVSSALVGTKGESLSQHLAELGYPHKVLAVEGIAELLIESARMSCDGHDHPHID